MAEEENLRGRIGDGVCSIGAVGPLFHLDLEVACSLLGIGIKEVEVKVGCLAPRQRGVRVLARVWISSCLWWRGAQRR